MTILLTVIEIFALYLLASLLIRFIIKILPSTISSGFEVIGEIRASFGKFVQSLYQSENNFEVNMLAIFFIPFAFMLFVYSFGSALVLLNTDAPVINIWLILTLIFVVSFVAPTEEELQVFRESTPPSIFLFIFKVFMVFQFVTDPNIVDADMIGLLVLLTPVSPMLRG